MGCRVQGLGCGVRGLKVEDLDASGERAPAVVGERAPRVLGVLAAGLFGF